MRIRDDLVEAHDRAWAAIAAPGTWLTGERRVAVAAEIRRARTCAQCARIKAAITTGKCIGRQPAMTALTASFSALMARWRTGSTPISCSGGIIAHSRHARTASSVGGTIGRPSVQPLE